MGSNGAVDTLQCAPLTLLLAGLLATRHAALKAEALLVPLQWSWP